MLKRHNRLLVAIYVLADFLAAGCAFILAYVVRFDSGLLPTPDGQPPFFRYVALAPAVGLLVPLAFRLQGLYRLRRGRTRVDDFFGVLVGSILAVLFGVMGTLYVNNYHLSDALKAEGFLEISRGVWILFLGLTVVFTYSSREAVRGLLRRRWRAGVGLKRVLVVGAGDLGRMVADRILEHGELGFRLIGFVDDGILSGDDDRVPRPARAGQPRAGAEVAARGADRRDLHRPAARRARQDAGCRRLSPAGSASTSMSCRTCCSSSRSARRLEDLDGLPIISVNDVPLQGMNSVIKRAVDIALSAAVVGAGAIPALVIASLIRRSSPGPVFYTQERNGARRQGVHRSTSSDRCRSTPRMPAGPVWARDDDPRVTSIGRWLRRYDIDELPQFWNVLKGDMSIVGPRPERPFFVEQFKHRIPQYMLRHKVKSGITGWAQVNGWRGNTSTREADRVRPLLHRELVAEARLQDHVADVRSRDSEGSLIPLCASSSPAPPASSDPICRKP